MRYRDSTNNFVAPPTRGSVDYYVLGGESRRRFDVINTFGQKMVDLVEISLIETNQADCEQLGFVVI